MTETEKKAWQALRCVVKVFWERIEIQITKR